MAIDALARGIAGAAQVGLAQANEKIDRLEGKTTRILYAEKTNPTASEIGTFVDGLGYTSPYEGIAVVVAGTYHIWHYYENDNIGWRDDGVDTITPFTNQLAGSILGSTDDGKISANQDGTGSVNGLPVIKSTGRSSVKTITENVDGDVDRTNTAAGPFSVTFGSRNTTGQNASESGAFGGDVHIVGENTYGFGYRVYGYRNQNLIGGYHIGSNAKESFIYGNEINVDCDRSPVDGNPKHDVFVPSDTAEGDLSKYLMVFGNDHNVGYQALSDLIVGANHTIGNNFQYSVLSGKKNTIGDNVEFVNVFGGTDNKIGENGGGISDCTVFGYKNTLYGGTYTSGSDTNKIDNVYIMGSHNANSKNTTAENFKHSVWLFGNYLAPVESGQFIVGEYNKISSNDQPNAYFLVGTGSADNTRRTSFAVCYNNNYGHHVYIGGKRLQEPTANGHVATEEYVGNIVGDINSALDAINGVVV